MTTLVAVNTRDAVVMGSDSLGTVTRQFVDPQELSEYFEMSNGCKLKVGGNGLPLLDDWGKILYRTVEIPYKHYNNIDKLFSLSPLEMGIMASGIATIGERTIKNLVSELRTTEGFAKLKSTDYTLKSVGQTMLDFLWHLYAEQYPNKNNRPELQLMLCGYDKNRFTPGVLRIYVHENRLAEADYDFCIFFGGITREIQRVVFGVDAPSKVRLMERNESILKKYHELMTEQLRASGVNIDLKTPEEFGDELKLFHGWNLEGLVANCGAFSEQTAIECIDFLVNVMIKSQQFSMQVPSVGGDVQIAVVKKYSGFNYVSRREWHHGASSVPMSD